MVVLVKIGMLNHMWGYCVEGKHRLLVYEYMEHGSLVENLCSNSLDWNKRFNVVVATAKGLVYVHEECLAYLHINKENETLSSSDNNLFVSHRKEFK
ncbi:Serine/Threonine kinase family protein [Medicago truncatula]|uniref:Serine/Threonine kinase family protein n=1 Tax=Medicago truncatula TaxID=3880 RepID=G7KSX1_MEDTR|nr:Serine/Threonine kinase family protein [Medicago truncatula]